MRRTVAELEELRDTCVSLQGSGGGAHVSDRVEGGGGELVRPEAEACARRIESKVREVMEVEQTQSYLHWMGKIQQTRSASYAWCIYIDL